jgi:hypothetical protein
MSSTFIFCSLLLACTRRREDLPNVVLHGSQDAPVVIRLREVPLPRSRLQGLRALGTSFCSFLFLSCPLSTSYMGEGSPPSVLATTTAVIWCISS